MSDIAKVMRARTTIVPEYTPTGSRGCGYVAKPDTECIAAADEIDRLRARIAELERALAECEHQTHSLRVWNGGEYAYHPPQAERIAKIARAAIEKATKK